MGNQTKSMLENIQIKLFFKEQHNLKSTDLKPITKKIFKLITTRNFYLKISLLILIKS